MARHSAVELSKDQKTALQKAKEKIASNSHLTISGSPGTGKTFLVRHIIEEFERDFKNDSDGESQIYLGAPTHQAKHELRNATLKTTHTIHSLLKLAPLEEEATEDGSLIFKQKEEQVNLKECKLLIIDEVSMIDQDLFNMILKNISAETSIIAIGDINQLPPVNNNDDLSTSELALSPFFKHQDFEVIHLNQIIRQEEFNPIIKISREVRDNLMLRELNKDGLGVFRVDGPNELLESYLRVINGDQEKFMKNRLVAYRNKDVDSFNNEIRKRVYKTTEPFIKDEIIVMQEPLLKKNNRFKKEVQSIIFTNSEWVRVNEVSEEQEEIITMLNKSIEIRYLTIKAQSIFGNVKGEINNIIPSYLPTYNKFLKDMALECSKITDSRERGAQWRQYFKIRERFQEVKALPACTVHKAQGSTFDNVFLYTGILPKTQDIRRRLLYTALTRAKYTATYC